MTRSARTLNRVLLLLVGLAAIGVGAVIGIPGLLARVALPDLTDPVTLWTTAAVATLVAALALAWTFTRGRGRSTSALRTDDVDIDTSVVAAVVRDALGSSPDVLSVDASAFARRRSRLVLLTVRTRRHPDLPVLRGRLARAVETLDTALGTELPLVVHITRGVGTRFAKPRTTH
ncbi:hypothetical protein [Microbacterium sp.]|uniref:hypothetical protein n=1 Tax=Microbacterium sp. TaxID=51671 RepID=UPI000928B291|nr:hypothetical protein [Microbacterium sp.]MBN9194409.1 hypothetical protein [Microbacterium sp.]OJU71919.1 MAG: hypothetical protein BGO04_01000 [Microbacterium sp. 70-38]